MVHWLGHSARMHYIMITKFSIFEQTLKNKTKKEILSGKLLEMIFTGLLQDGDELPSERELGSLFGVSRETVRGALSLISAYGLIQVSHGAKTRVKRNKKLLDRCEEIIPELGNLEINNYNIHNVFESRIIIESAIARKIATLIDDKGLKKMEQSLRQQADLFDQPVHFQLADKRFHKLISEYSKNEILINQSEELYSYGLNFRRAVMLKKGTIERSYREHVALYEALKLKDPDAAEQAMKTHLTSVYETTLEESIDT